MHEIYNTGSKRALIIKLDLCATPVHATGGGGTFCVRWCLDISPRVKILGEQGSGLLADQLYRPALPSITPALRFGFAVDCWGRAKASRSSTTVNYVFPFIKFRGIPKKCHSAQVFAPSEGSMPDAGDAITNCDAGQAGAFIEGPLSDAGDAIRDRDARQAGAAVEGSFPDAGDRFAFNGRRYD